MQETASAGAHGCGDGGRLAGILAEEGAAGMHVGAGDVDLEGRNARNAVEPGSQLAELLGRGGVDVGHHRDVLPGEQGQLLLDEGLHAVVLEPHGVEHAAGRLRHARRGVAGPWLEGKALDDDAAEGREVAVVLELEAVAEGSRGGHDRILQVEAVPGALEGDGEGVVLHGLCSCA